MTQHLRYTLLSRRLSQIHIERKSKLFYHDSLAITYASYGDPTKTLVKTNISLPKKLSPNEILVKMMAAPINPADINMIEGVYPIKPALPAVAGNEGVGIIVDTGSDVQTIECGDWVIPSTSGWGTWRTMAICAEEEVKKIDNDIPVTKAATIAVNPCTAYRLLLDFVNLKPGDTVIQNGANSAVGQAVIQIANSMDLKTVNILRPREDLKQLTEYLKGIGATQVLTEEESRYPETKELWKVLKKPMLALNCVGGKSATQLIRHLDKNGVMVTYGGMSRQPVTIPTAQFIFNNIKLVGFWMTEWNLNNRSCADGDKMLKYLCDLIHKGKLQQPICEFTHISDYANAVKASLQSRTSKKQILYMDDAVCQ
ncbi:enoyl-[acyl-carrier-protein] reductase, mitochondrial-like [Tubulanus polymorphus]|uniref:enoyl-[acyl-carrier-protein] reductase, mitochondrial-like n=1 Tax=Tubulanus polymorphus TaxID=672921 RepID=UPI003DA4286F